LARIESNAGGSIDFTYDGSGRLSSIRDQAGRIWNYRYEILGRLQFVDNPDGTTREYHYEDLRHAYALTGITTENGQRFSHYEYDDEGLAIASYHAGNANRVDIQYEANGDRVVVDPLGNATVYQTRKENKRGVLEGISGPACSQGCGQTDTSYSYDSNLNVTSKTVYGVTTQYGNYDSRGQAGYTIQAVGTAEEKRIDYEYDPAFRNRITRISEPSVYAGESRITTRSYDFAGNLLSETISGFDPFGRTVSRTISNTYNGPFGQITSSDGPRSDVNDLTRYEYYPNDDSQGDHRARLKAVVDANGIRIRDNITYSETGRVLSEARPNGITVDYEYYAGSHRIKSITESGGGLFNRTQWEYFPVGDVQRIIIDDETGKEIITQFEYDSARRLDRVSSRVSRTQSGQYYRYTADQWETFRFDDAGNIISETRESRDTPHTDIIIDRVFDAYDRIDTLTIGGITEDYDYNPDGTLAAKTDGNLKPTIHTYDAFKRLTSTEQVGQAITAMTYDTHGNNLAVNDAENNSTQYLYDDLGNRIRRDSPDTGLSTFSYDESGNMLSQTDAKGQTSVFSHDAAGRLTGIDRAGPDYDVTYTYDSCTHGVGRLCEITTSWGHTIHYAWNAVGELSSVTSNEGQLRYTFGPQKTLTSIEYPSGRVIRYEIDGGGLPVRVNLSLAGLPETTLLEDIKYSPLNRPVSWRFVNGQSTTIALDGRHRPISIDVPGVWNWQASVYDANDNILNLTHSGNSFNYGYDALDRLTAADTAAQSIGFAYDDVGNRLLKTTDGVEEPSSYETGSNRIATFGDQQFTLDQNGNTTAVSVNGAPVTNYVYSSHDRLIEVNDEPSSSRLATYRYDALGQRVEKVTATETRRFVYGLNGELLAETDGAGRVLHEYVYLNGMPVIDLAEVPDGLPDSGSTELVFDNDNAVVIGGNWQTKSSSAAENGSYLQNRKRADRAVYWYVDETSFQGGRYDIYVKWLTPAGSGSKTSYRIAVWNESGSSESFLVDVSHADQNVGDWVFLGNFAFQDNAGSRWQRVSLLGPDNDSGLEGAYIRADAVKLVSTSDPMDLVDLKFIHNDHLGAPQRVTDESGQIVWSASYRPFGEATVDEDPDGDGVVYALNFRFPGQYYDAESGLHYNYFRTYNPSIGRYMESDPIGLLSDVNTYAYPDPIGAVDRYGLCAELISGEVRKTDWYVDGVWPIFSSARINDADRLVVDVQGNLHVGAIINCILRCGDCDSTPQREWTLYEYADFQGLVIPFVTPEHFIPSPSRIVSLVRILVAGRKVAIFKQDANRLLESLIGLGADRLCRYKRKNTSDIRPGFP
jgi:RHS repeat-associated protein